MLQQLPFILLFAVLCVGSLGVVGMFGAGIKQARRGHQQRMRRKAYARLAEVAQMKAEEARIKAEQAARAAQPQPVPLPRGELTCVIKTLEESVRFARVASPPPVPRRTARGSVAPPVRATRPADQREHRATAADIRHRVLGAAKRA